MDMARLATSHSFWQCVHTTVFDPEAYSVESSGMEEPAKTTMSDSPHRLQGLLAVGNPYFLISPGPVWAPFGLPEAPELVSAALAAPLG